MGVKESLAALEARGVKVWVDDGQICFRGPKHPSNAADLAVLKTDTMATLALLMGAVATAAANRPERIPLSASQAMWFRPDDVLRVPSELRRTPALFHLFGELSREALSGAIDRLLQRHDILRTRYCYDGEMRWQEVLESPPTPLEIADLAEFAKGQQHTRVFARLRSLFHEEPDHSVGRPIHCLLFRLGAAEHCLVVMIDHIALDNLSMRNVVRELFKLYDTLAHGEPDTLTERPSQYADFAIRTNQRAAVGQRARNEAIWREEARGLSPLQVYDGAWVDKAPSTIGRELIPIHEVARAQVAGFAREAGVPVSILFQTAFCALLADWRRQERMLLGCVVDDRPKAMRDAVGSFIRTSPYIVDLTGQPSGREAIARVRRAYLEAIDPKRAVEPGVFPGLSNVTLNIQRREAAPVLSERLTREKAGWFGGRNLGQYNALRPDHPGPPGAAPPRLWSEKQAGRLRTAPWRLPGPLNDTVQTDFQVYMFERPDLMHGHVVFAADRVPQARATWFCRAVQPLLTRLATRPDAPLWSLIPGLDEISSRPVHAPIPALSELTAAFPE